MKDKKHISVPAINVCMETVHIHIRTCTYSSKAQRNMHEHLLLGRAGAKPHTTEFYAFRGILCMYIYIYIYLSVRPPGYWRMRQMFHVKHGVDAPPTTCMRSPKRKRLRNRCFATATDINGCSVARSIEVTMVGTLDRSRLPRSAIMAAQVQSTDVFLCYQRLRVSCALCNNFQAARPRQTTERRLAPLYDKS